jgi:hypothetical protein
MSLLRDESGYVLVFRRPRLVRVEKDDGKGPESSSPVVDEPASALCCVPHCCFYCAWCGEPILLPNDRIGSPFGFPDARKIEVRCVATVCFACKHIGNYSMFHACRGFDTRHKIVHAQMSGETVLLNWLHCEELTCMERVPLFVKIDRNNPPGEREAAEWLWDEVTCGSGHRINKIALDPTLELPLRTHNKAK